MNFFVRISLTLTALLIVTGAQSQPLSEREFPENQVIFSGQGAITAPAGTTAARPTAVNGMFRYNTTEGKFEWYENGVWTTPTLVTSFSDDEFSIVNIVDPTKTLVFDASAISTGTTRTISAPDSSGVLALLGIDQSFTGLNTFTQDVVMSGNGQFTMPVGTTAERSASPLLGMTRYNTDLNVPEIYDGVSWVPLTATLSLSGPASSLDNAVVRFDGATGKIAKDSKVTIDDQGKIVQTDLGQSVFIGLEAGMTDNLSDNRNVAVGHHALRSNATGSLNVAIGYQAARRTSANYNVAIGAEALENSGFTSSTGNVAIGARSLWSQYSSTSRNNTAIGHYAQRLTSSGLENTSVGAESLENNLTGDRNVAMGHQAGTRILGDDNTALGNRALSLDAGGAMYRNTVIGSSAGSLMGTATDNILIGYNVQTPSPTDSYQINIGDYIVGDMANKLLGIGVTNPTVALDVDGAAKFTGGLDAAGDMTAQTLVTTGDVTVGGIGQIKIPSGTTAERAAVPTAGMMRYNTTLQYFEGFNGVGWVQMEVGAAASGDVVGPLTATANALTRYSGTTGKIIQDSLVTLDDLGNIAGVNDLAAADITSNTIVVTGTTVASHPCPSMTELERDLLTPVAGDCIFNITSSATEDYNGSTWIAGGYTGPALATDNAIVRFDGTSGVVSQDSSVIIDDLSNITGVNDLTISGAIAGISDLAIAGELTGVTDLTLSGSVVGLSDLAIAGELTGVTDLTLSGSVVGISDLAIAGELTGVTDLTLSGAIAGISDLAIAGELTGVTDISASGDISALTSTSGSIIANSTTVASAPCPSMTTVQRDATTPIIGNCVYNTDDLAVQFWEGTEWLSAGTSSLEEWLTATDYIIGDLVYTPIDFKLWRANTDHTSTVFATDIAKWDEVSKSGDLQTAYDNSAQPQIALDAVRNGVQILDAATPIAAPLFEILSSDTLTNYFRVNASGVELEEGVSAKAILDEDDLASDRVDALATQQSIKAYVDAHESVALMAKGSLLGSDGVTNTEQVKCGNEEYLVWDDTEALGFKCETKVSGGLPLMAKGSLLTSNGTFNGEFDKCADDEYLVWDSAEATGFKCETVVVDTNTNTNAATICAAGEYLDGDGTCKTPSIGSPTAIDRACVWSAATVVTFSRTVSVAAGATIKVVAGAESSRLCDTTYSSYSYGQSYSKSLMSVYRSGGDANYSVCGGYNAYTRASISISSSEAAKSIYQTYNVTAGGTFTDAYSCGMELITPISIEYYIVDTNLDGSIVVNYNVSTTKAGGYANPTLNTSFTIFELP